MAMMTTFNICEMRPLPLAETSITRFNLYWFILAILLALGCCVLCNRMIAFRANK